MTLITERAELRHDLSITITSDSNSQSPRLRLDVKKTIERKVKENECK